VHPIVEKIEHEKEEVHIAVVVAVVVEQEEYMAKSWLEHH
jgi:hypothetical protein